MGRSLYSNNRGTMLSANEGNSIVPVNTNCDNASSKNESILGVLYNFLGRNCNCQFNTYNSRNLEEVNGIIEEIGGDYIIIRSMSTGRKTICNACNLQFVNIL